MSTKLELKLSHKNILYCLSAFSRLEMLINRPPMPFFYKKQVSPIDLELIFKHHYRRIFHNFDLNLLKHTHMCMYICIHFWVLFCFFFWRWSFPVGTILTKTSTDDWVLCVQIHITDDHIEKFRGSWWGLMSKDKTQTGHTDMAERVLLLSEELMDLTEIAIGS